MSTDVLIPFAIIVGLSLAIIMVVHVVEGYESPQTARHSIRRILCSVSGSLGGFIIAHLALNGFEFSEQIWGVFLGIATASVVLFVIDVMVMNFKARQVGAVKQDD